MNTKMLLAGTAAALVCAAGSAGAVTINLMPVYPGTISGSVPYTPNETLKFTFTVKSPYTFTFIESGSGGTFPYPITVESTGSAGAYTETFPKVPASGVVDYSLTTAVPEPATWALMMVGFGLAGASMRRRARVQATA
jgi:hypothetical protein